MNNKGSAMIFLVIVIALVNVLGASLMNIVMINYHIRKSNTNIKQAFYLAEHGINMSYAKARTLIDDAIEDSIKKAEEYLGEYPAYSSEAENIFKANYKLNITSNIKKRINTTKNPTVLITNENPAFSGIILRIELRSSYDLEGKAEKIAWAELYITVPEYLDVKEGNYDTKKYVELKNWWLL